MDTAGTLPETHANRISAGVLDHARGNWIAQTDPILERGVQWLLALLLFFSVAFMGGPGHWGWLAWSEMVFAGTVGLATLLWLARLAIRPQQEPVFSWSLVLLGLGGLIGL